MIYERHGIAFTYRDTHIYIGSRRLCGGGLLWGQPIICDGSVIDFKNICDRWLVKYRSHKLYKLEGFRNERYAKSTSGSIARRSNSVKQEKRYTHNETTEVS